MREILFRGIDKSTCKWVYGDLLQRDSNKSIKAIMPYFPNTKSVVVKDYTVGQYTGLTDKNGKKIFEGDIVVNSFPQMLSNKPHLVEFINGKWSYITDEKRVVKVIGNIHDNPELLRGDNR